MGEGVVMGSGSAGGGGGGTGGATSGGGPGYGGYEVDGNRIVVRGVSKEDRNKALALVLKKFRPEYIREQFVTSSAREIHHELAFLSVDLRLNRQWKQITERLGVDGGSGCLPKLAAELMRRHETADRNQKSRAFVRLALENFLVRMVGDDSEVFTSGTAEEVVQHLKPDVFRQLANYFLGDLLYEVIRGEEKALPPEIKDGLRGEVQDRARHIVDDFMDKFGNRPLGEDIRQASYGNLFDGIARKEDWFLSQLRG
jgi:hypothetical protein